MRKHVVLQQAIFLRKIYVAVGYTSIEIDDFYGYLLYKSILTVSIHRFRSTCILPIPRLEFLANLAGGFDSIPNINPWRKQIEKKTKEKKISWE